MRSNGLATIMLLIPVLTVPALAIFGIPQFAPVVASPLDEGQEKGKESRVGNSARQSHDDLFGDVDEFASDPSVQDDFSPHRRDTQGMANSHRQGTSRRSDKSTRSGWSDDLDDDSEWATKPARRSAQSFDEPLNPPRSNAAKISKKSTVLERSSRDSRRQFEGGKREEAVRVASVVDEGSRVVSAGFTEDAEPEKLPAADKGNRSRLNDSRGSKRRDSANEPLTWQGAVERLNALDIRNFRLEPGHQLGQFVFICSYTPPDNPRVSYRFEAGADEPLKAVEKVLEQIIEWQKSR